MAGFIGEQGVAASFVLNTGNPSFQNFARVNVQPSIVSNGVGDCTVSFVEPIDVGRAVVSVNVRSNVDVNATVEVQEPGGAFCRVRCFQGGIAFDAIVDVVIRNLGSAP